MIAIVSAVDDCPARCPVRQRFFVRVPRCSCGALPVVEVWPLARRVGSCSSRPSRRSVVPGRDRSGGCAGSRRCAAGRRLAGSASRCRAARRRADLGVGGRALVVRTDCRESWRAARSIGSGRRSAGVRGAVRGGDSTPQSKTGAAEWPITGAMPSENWGRGNGPISAVHCHGELFTVDQAFPQGKILGERRQNWGRSPSGTSFSGGVRNSALWTAFWWCPVKVCTVNGLEPVGHCVTVAWCTLRLDP